MATSLGFVKVCSPFKFKTYFFYHKDIWIESNDYHTYFDLIVLFVLYSYTSIDKFYNFIIYNLLINAVLLLSNCPVLIHILYLSIHFLFLACYFLYLNIIWLLTYLILFALKSPDFCIVSILLSGCGVQASPIPSFIYSFVTWYICDWVGEGSKPTISSLSQCHLFNKTNFTACFATKDIYSYFFCLYKNHVLVIYPPYCFDNVSYDFQRPLSETLESFRSVLEKEKCTLSIGKKCLEISC